MPHPQDMKRNGDLMGNQFPIVSARPRQMIRKTTLEKFVRLGGYNIVRQTEEGWSGISRASRKTGISRPTIYEILKAHPEQPEKTFPKYVAEFRKSEGYQRLFNFYRPRFSEKTWKRTCRDVLNGWKILGKKDPISWSKQDFVTLWNHEKIYDDVAEGFREESASSFHRLMEQINRHDLTMKFKGVKRPQGSKKQWFLSDSDIRSIVPCMTQRITLILTECGIFWGARISALLALKMKDIHFQNQSVTVYEQKMKRKQPYVEKYPPLCLFQILRRWIEDEDLGPEDPVFPISADTYNNKHLKEAGQCARLKKTLTSHILKHTFVSQGHRHGLSRETVVEMTGTEDQTIRTFYLDVDEHKIRAETQGLQKRENPFWKWAEDLHSLFVVRYRELG